MKSLSKRLISIIVVTLLLSTNIYAGPVRTLDIYQLSTGTSKYLNGKEIMWADFIEGNRTYVKLTDLADQLGVYVGWNGATKSVNFENKGKQISLRIDSKKATVDGEETIILAPPRIRYGSTYLPLRSVTELLDINLNYVDMQEKEKQAKEMLFNLHPGWRARVKEGKKSTYPFTLEVQFYDPENQSFLFAAEEFVNDGGGYGHFASCGYREVNVNTGVITDFITGDRIR